MRTLIQKSILLTRLFYPQAIHRMSTNFFQSDRTIPPKESKSESVDVSSDIISQAYELCSEHLGGAWSSICPLQLSVTPVSGGLSNSIYRCSLPNSVELNEGEPSQVILRIYGEHSGNCDIDVQLEIFIMLSNLGLGPKLYGKFEGGRLEEFLIADSLTSEEMRTSEISSIIAKKLAMVHGLNVPMNKTANWLEGKYEEFVKFVKETNFEESFEVLNESTIDIARKLLAVDFSKETEYVLENIRRMNSPIVLSHNDLHQGNILITKHSKKRPTCDQRLFLIDFEYCSYNYRAYDIANHFSEWCFEYDTPEYPHFKMEEERFPSIDDQINFLRNYVKHFMGPEANGDTHHPVASTKSPEKVSPEMVSDGKSCNGKIDYDMNGNDNTFESIDQDSICLGEDISIEKALLAEIRPFLMGANLLWALWAIKSTRTSNITFGYWEHAMARWNLYLKFKDSYIKGTELKKPNGINGAP